MGGAKVVMTFAMIANFRLALCMSIAFFYLLMVLTQRLGKENARVPSNCVHKRLGLFQIDGLLVALKQASA